MIRRTRSGIRHDDGPIPADVAGQIARSRKDALSSLIAAAAIIGIIIAFGRHLL